MVTKRTLLATSAGILSIPFINTLASANIRWQMAISVPETNYLGRVIKEFVDEVREGTNGAFSIALHSRSSLMPDGQVLRALRSGQLQSGMFLLPVHGNEDPFFEVEGIPFLANSWPEARALRSAAEPYVRERLTSRRATELFSLMWPSQGIYSQVPVSSLADLRDHRFRVYNRITVRMATLAGTRPVNLCCNPAEVSLAFASGMIESMFTSAQSGVDSQIWDYVKYFTDVGGMRNRSVIAANTDAFNRLPNDIKQVVQRAASVANAKGFEAGARAEVDMAETLRRNGITVYPAPTKLMEELREIGTQLAGEWVVRAGPEGGALMARYRELTNAARG